MAMAGGTDPSKLGAALAGVKDWVASKWAMPLNSISRSMRLVWTARFPSYAPRKL
jgi:hypothetical protein